MPAIDEMRIGDGPTISRFTERSCLPFAVVAIEFGHDHAGVGALVREVVFRELGVGDSIDDAHKGVLDEFELLAAGSSSP